MTITASEFKAKCLSLIDQVNRGSEPIIITKRGRVVAKLTGETSVDEMRETREKLAALIEIHGDILSPVVNEGDIEAYNS